MGLFHFGNAITNLAPDFPQIARLILCNSELSGWSLKHLFFFLILSLKYTREWWKKQKWIKMRKTVENRQRKDTCKTPRLSNNIRRCTVCIQTVLFVSSGASISPYPFYSTSVRKTFYSLFSSVWYAPFWCTVQLLKLAAISRSKNSINTCDRNFRKQLGVFF